MSNQMTLDRLEQMRGAPVYDTDGDKIGKVEEIFYDQDTNRPEWIGIGTGFFGTKRVLVPVAGANATEDGVTVPYDKAKVKDSPDVDADEISQATERELYAYYGLEYSERRSDTGLPAADYAMERDDAGTGGTVTRHEEELQVGKREVEAGRLRLHKWVETEQVDVPVEVRREKARVYREPVDEAVTDRELGDESVEVTLREEEPVVQKRAVAKERVGIDKDVDVERETVGGEVRKERVEVEGDEDPRS